MLYQSGVVFEHFLEIFLHILILHVVATVVNMACADIRRGGLETMGF